MSWVENLLSYCTSGRLGKCPVCGGEKVSVHEQKCGDRKSLSFMCDECKSADHFDGMIGAKST